MYAAVRARRNEGPEGALVFVSFRAKRGIPLSPESSRRGIPRFARNDDALYIEIDRGIENEMPGKVYLVGAGPGDPELLTRKAWRVLQSADAVLHDDLVPEEILAILPASARILNVGKRCGAKGISQPEINDRMISLAHEGKIVARLKSGDPLLFGRAGEEMEAL